MEKTINKNMTKIGIYLCALLMMGAIAVASNLANIMAAFPEESPTTIVAYMISVPCMIVIPVTIITGKLMGQIAKKTLMIVGVILWLVGGVTPYCMDSLQMIFAMRCLFGVGLGMVQTLCAALVVENFEDPEERDKTMGNMSASQMLGCIIFSLVAGNLGQISWNVAFLVHLIAVISLVGAIVCLPYQKPVAISASGEKVKFTPTPSMWIWVVAILIYLTGGQTYANSASAIITEMNLGDSVAAGYSLAIFAVGGLLMGIAYGKVAKIFGKMTLSAGCVLMSCGYLLIVFANGLAMSYLGAFFCGLSISMCLACIMNGSAGSVPLASSGMAVSIATCLQNVGMALCPYVVNAAGASIANGTGSFTTNQGALLSGLVILMALAIAFPLLQGRKKA
ncbi:MFS transporter [Chakrabartyella piscis]|uniref:MFS transporter n=1 Tax=Chakrabartyella piscis TaxID=2918914 RepID=UPI002958A3ED|nr:MFS transporter [Chakrabartyella piscis]